MTKFVDRLLGCTGFPVARFRENKPSQQMTLDLLVQYTRDEGDSLRSRNNTLAKRVQPSQLPTTLFHSPTPELKPTKTSPPPTWYVGFVELVEVVTSYVHSYENQDDLLALTEGDERWI